MAEPVDLRDLGIAKLREALRRIQQTEITIGWQGPSGAAPHPDAKASGRFDGTVAAVAAVNHYGTEDGRIPARPALDETFNRHRHEIIVKARRIVADVVDGRIAPEAAEETLGEYALELLRRTLDDARVWAQANAERTIRAKGHDQPLFGETGTLRSHASWAARMDGAITRQGGETGD